MAGREWCPHYRLANAQLALYSTSRFKQSLQLNRTRSDDDYFFPQTGRIQ